MMKKMLCALVFCMLALPASAQPVPQAGKSYKQASKEQKKAQHLCQKHTDWSIDDCKQIAQGHSWIGMTDVMLYALYGRPRSFSTANRRRDGHCSTVHG
jgi:hypothetical protein